MRIRYDEYRMRVTQHLDTFYCDHFEGELSEVQAKIAKIRKDYADYLVHPHAINETSYGGNGGYIDGAKMKKVIFDKLSLDLVSDDYSDGKNYALVGERDMLPEELEALKAKQSNQQSESRHRDLEQLRKLREKYPDA